MNEALRNRDGIPPGPNTLARLIVWERDGSWARHLRRILAPGRCRVYEVRTSAACREMVAGSPASIVVAEWTPSVCDELASLVTFFRCSYPSTRMIAVAGRNVEPLRWQLMETGIVWVCTSPRELKPVVEIVRRHLEQVPRPSRSPEQRIWDELPWPETV